MPAIDGEVAELLQSAIGRYAADAYDFASRGAKLTQYPASALTAWRDYAELGWLAVPLPPEQGGFGSHPSVVGPLMRFAGAHLVLEPLFATLVLCGRALALSMESGGSGGQWLERIGAGEAIFALAQAEHAEPGSADTIACRSDGDRIDGNKVMVLGGDLATHLIVSVRDGEAEGISLFVVAADAPGISRTPYRLVDGRGAASFRFSGATGEPLGTRGGGALQLDFVLQEARLALCHEILGVIEALNRQTLEHLKTRQQFGKPIGSNQALQHRMVELYMLETEVRAMIALAVRSWSGAMAERQRLISAALAYAIGAGRRAAQEAVQMHGGMGITEELPVSHLFRRMMVLERLLGSRDDHLAAFERADRLRAGANENGHG